MEIIYYSVIIPSSIVKMHQFFKLSRFAGAAPHCVDGVVVHMRTVMANISKLERCSLFPPVSRCERFPAAFLESRFISIVDLYIT